MIPPMGQKMECYTQVRDQMKPGDVIAFSGKGNFSDIIKWATRSAVSHVGVIAEVQLRLEGAPLPAGLDRIVQVLESTTLTHRDGQTIAGVQSNRLSTHIEYYDGNIWWLPLSEEIRKKLDLTKFTSFLFNQVGKAYDMPQAIASALDLGDQFTPEGVLTHNREDCSRFFCSELVAKALEIGGAIDHLNASEVTPVDLCNFKIYAENYVQLKGPKPAIIKGYNSLSPSGWGE